MKLYFSPRARAGPWDDIVILYKQYLSADVLLCPSKPLTWLVLSLTNHIKISPAQHHLQRFSIPCTVLSCRLRDVHVTHTPASHLRHAHATSIDYIAHVHTTFLQQLNFYNTPVLVTLKKQKCNHITAIIIIIISFLIWSFLSILSQSSNAG